MTQIYKILHTRVGDQSEGAFCTFDDVVDTDYLQSPLVGAIRKATLDEVADLEERGVDVPRENSLGTQNARASANSASPLDVARETGKALADALAAQTAKNNTKNAPDTSPAPVVPPTDGGTLPN